MTVLESALRYADLGWSVLPLCPPNHLGVGRVHAKTCSHPGKRPHLPDRDEPARDTWKEFQARRATAAEIRRWWDVHPHLNVGLALGPVSALVAIDIDTDDGEKLLAELSGGDLPPTLEYRTGRGKRPLYRLPPGAAIATTAFTRPGTRVETLRLMSTGSQVVLPPSIHPNGSVYTWTEGRGPGEIEPADVPGWWLSLKPGRGGANGPADPADGEIVGEGGRNAYLCRLAGAIRRVGGDHETILAALASFNERRCDPPLTEREVQAIARSVASYPPFRPVRVTMTGVGRKAGREPLSAACTIPAAEGGEA
jgi:hypothetical protein